VEQWAEIRRLHFAEGMGIKTIARSWGWRWILCDRVAELRPLYLQPEGTGRTTYEPGETTGR
jgi:hypothetical protein